MLNWSQPIKGQCCAGPALVGLIARCPSAITIRTLKMCRLITYRTWKLHSTPGATQQGLGGEQEKGERGLGFCFHWCRGLWGLGFPRNHSFLVNLKHKSQNLKDRKRKQTSSPIGQLLKLTKISQTKELSAGGCLALSGWMAWLTKCLLG